MNWLKIRQASPVIYLAYLAVLSLLLGSCKNDPKSIGDEINPAGSLSGVFYTDTLSLSSSTVSLIPHLDSSSRGTQYINAGNYQDPDVGTITTKGYDQITLQNYVNLDTFELERATMHLFTDKYYYYGDTNSAQTMDIVTVTEPILKDGSITNSSERSTGSSMATFSISGPNINYYNRINLDQTIYQLVLANKDRFLSFNGNTTRIDSLFDALFYGIAIVPQSNRCLLRFDVFASKISLFLRKKSDNSKKDSIVLNMSNSVNRYSKISYQRAGSTLSSLTNDYDSLNSVQTNNKTYMVSGLGLYTKILFRNIDQFNKPFNGKLIINKAILEIKCDPSASASVTLKGVFANELNSSYQKDFYTDNGSKTILDQRYAKIFLSSEGTTTDAPSSYTQFVGLNTTTDIYQFDVTLYVQAYLNHQRTFHGMLLSPKLINDRVVKTVIPDYSQGGLKLKLYYSFAE